ncbi:MAG TPA: hypothetical protein VGQ42_15750 [Candidatus Dormibacteraeota bacterium]|jgi:hypothetical protein|nr:hypothetical protein [Candidatus Dormibacteraeota bacterium]
MRVPITTATNNQAFAVCEVLDERDHQDVKWGVQDHDPFTYVAILGEEFGEFCREVLESNRGVPTTNLYTEAVQVAAVALKIIECLRWDQWGWSRPATEEQVWEDCGAREIADMCA